MTHKPYPARARPSIRWPVLLLVASIGLNFLLGCYLFRPKSGRDDSPIQTETTSPSVVALTSLAPGAATPEVSLAADGEALSGFHWDTMESSDYRQYIANLRAAGFPETTIRDIVLTDLNQQTRHRARDIWTPTVTPYWQKSNPDNRPSPKQMQQFFALAEEQKKICRELLGVSLDQQKLIDIILLQLHGSEHELLFLPADRREAALAALADSDLETKSQKLRAGGNTSADSEQALFNEKVKLLTGVLSPDELAEFRKLSPTRTFYLQGVQYLDLSPEEFQQVVDVRESNLNKSTAEVIKELFGAAKAKELERVTTPHYLNARAAAELDGTPLALVDRGAEIADAFANQVPPLVNDNSLSAAERKAKLAELRFQAETQIKAVMGEPAADTMLKSLRQLFKVWEANIPK